MDTTDILQIKITEARNLLSKESREAIDVVNWKLTLLGMSTKYNQDQLENLETETELLLCGILNPEDYPVELQTRMHITKDATGLLIEEMDKLIFKKIQENLEKRLAEKNKTITPTIIPKPFTLDPRFAGLPKDIQEAIASSGWKEILYEIIKEYKVTVDKMGLLEEITIKRLLGIIPIDQYENEIKSKIGLPEDQTKELIIKINEKIFKNIKEIMKGGVIINYETKIKNEDIPLPPYAKKVEENKAFSSPSVKEIPEGQKESSIIEKPIEQKESELDPYREHGIEILSDENINNGEIVPELKQEENKISSSLPMIETQREQKVPVVDEVIKTEEKKENTINDINTAQELVNPKIGSFDKSNIITDKLFGNTSSKSVVSDYSLPKMSSSTQPSLKVESEIPENSHDPYHEAI